MVWFLILFKFLFLNIWFIFEIVLLLDILIIEIFVVFNGVVIVVMVWNCIFYFLNLFFCFIVYNFGCVFYIFNDWYKWVYIMFKVF